MRWHEHQLTPILLGIHSSSIQHFQLTSHLCSPLSSAEMSYFPTMHATSSLGARTNLAPPTTFEVGKFGLALLGPIKLSGRALYDDGQMINRNVINHVTKELLG